jgi:hypothetical protein
MGRGAMVDEARHGSRALRGLFVLCLLSTRNASARSWPLYHSSESLEDHFQTQQSLASFSYPHCILHGRLQSHPSFETVADTIIFPFLPSARCCKQHSNGTFPVHNWNAKDRCRKSPRSGLEKRGQLAPRVQHPGRWSGGCGGCHTSHRIGTKHHGMAARHWNPPPTHSPRMGKGI